MDKFLFVCACLFLSLVMGGTWGGLLYWFHPAGGLSIGFCLFVLCFLALMNNGYKYDNRVVEHNRRFNDV